MLHKHVVSVYSTALWSTELVVVLRRKRCSLVFNEGNVRPEHPCVQIDACARATSVSFETVSTRSACRRKKSKQMEISK